MSRGSRPFGPIYSNFQDLLDNNQGIFRLFKKTKNPGMYQAVWLARQGEVDTLKERLEQNEHCVASYQLAIKELESHWQERQNLWFEQYQSQNNTIEELRHDISHKESLIQQEQFNKQERADQHQTRINGLETEIEVWKEKSTHLREELEKYKTLNRSLQRVIDMGEQKDSKFEADYRKMKTHLELSQQALIKLDDEYEKVCHENKVLKDEKSQLAGELTKNKTYSNEYRKINHKMENELYRLTSELEKIQFSRTQQNPQNNVSLDH